MAHYLKTKDLGDILQNVDNSVLNWAAVVVDEQLLILYFTGTFPPSLINNTLTDLQIT